MIVTIHLGMVHKTSPLPFVVKASQCMVSGVIEPGMPETIHTVERINLPLKNLDFF